MLSEMFSKNKQTKKQKKKKLIYKEKCETVKNKECKKHYYKKSQLRIFFKYLSIVSDSFILKLSIGVSISTARLMWRYGVRKIRTSFKTLVSKKMTIWWLEKSHNSDELLQKIISSSYHMEPKAYIEASCVFNIHTGETKNCSCNL